MFHNLPKTSKPTPRIVAALLQYNAGDVPAFFPTLCVHSDFNALRETAM
jgi:hypothetical protein